MTIGIGVLATTPGGRKSGIVPDTAVLVADTMGSFEDADSHARLHKVISLPEYGLYATVAGDISRGAQLMPCLGTFIKEIPAGQKMFGKIQLAIAEGCFEYKQHLFTLIELPKLRLAPHTFSPNQKLDPELNEKIQAEWRKFDIGCDLVIAAFDDAGRAYLFLALGREHEIRNVSFPGYAAVGSGAENAMFWLSRRQHTLGFPLLCASYHAYEAKLMAEGSAHVNKHLDIIVATATDHWMCTSHAKLTAEKEHPDINLPALKKLFRKFGPKDTVKLWNPRP
jgi:hypothetical protein